MDNEKKLRDIKTEVEVVDGSVSVKGSTFQQGKKMQDEGVEPHEVSKSVMTTCRNGACGMEFMNGVDRCPYCGTRHKK